MYFFRAVVFWTLFGFVSCFFFPTPTQFPGCGSPDLLSWRTDHGSMVSPPIKWDGKARGGCREGRKKALPPAEIMLAKSLLWERLWWFYSHYSSPPPSKARRGYFFDLSYENLVWFLEAKVMKVWGPSRIKAPRCSPHKTISFFHASTYSVFINPSKPLLSLPTNLWF